MLPLLQQTAAASMLPAAMTAETFARAGAFWARQMRGALPRPGDLDGPASRAVTAAPRPSAPVPVPVPDVAVPARMDAAGEPDATDATAPDVELREVDGTFTAVEEVLATPAPDVEALVDEATDGKLHQTLPEGVARPLADT